MQALLRAAVAALLALSLAPQPAHAADKPARRPNIVLILADDLGYGDLGCYGHPKFKTPHLDRMAAEGVRLTQFNTPMPYCAPTRASLMTGRYPGRCGLTANPTPDGAPAADALALPLSEVTLAQSLKDAGYATGMLGKWHLGHQKPEFLPTRRGFDEYFGIPYSNDMRPVKLLDGEKAVEYPVVQATLTKRYTERALTFLERNRDRPFFLYFAHAAPHKPLACSEDFYKKSGAGLYGDVVSELDESVGQVLKKLKDLGLDEQTLVVFTSDNGPWFGGSSGGLRGMKGTTWEGGYRVPCIVRWPGKLPAKQTSDGLATMPDLFATALAAAGVAPPRGRTLDGRDLLPMLEGKARSPHEIILEYQGDKIAAVRDARWKLHLIPARDNRIVEAGDMWIDPRAPDGVTLLAPFEQFKPTAYPGLREGDETRALSLFDLEKDPAEQRDVAAKNPDVVARLKAAHEQASKDLAAKADKRQALPDYRPAPGWPKLPDEIKLGPVSAVATDSADRVYVFHRGKHPILVFDRDGKFLRSWGDDLIKTAHGLRIDHENHVWVTDIGNHQVLKFDAEGKLLLTLGKKGDPGDGPDRFNKPTDVAVTPTGEFYVSDGYGNARVLKFSKDGKFLKEWGKKGTGEGEFDLPHAICLDARGRVYVGDRENNRIQVFDGDGKFLAVLKESGAPYGLFLSEGRLFVADARAHWVKVLDLEGKVLGRWGAKGSGPGQFNSPHMLCVDARGAVYVAEVDGRRVQKFVAERPGADDKAEPIRPKEVIKLFNGKDLTGLTTWLKDGKKEDPRRVFTVTDGELHISGDGFGYLATDKEYQDYHLIVEYRWGKRTDGGKFVRNSGVLLHAVGPDGGANGTWMSCIECQLAQGCNGDLIPIRGKDARGEVIPVAFKSETALGPDKRPRWKKGGDVLTFTNRQLWWSLHDPDFKELLDTRGKDDVESPLGEWTKVECLCEGARITVRINGTTVNECYDVFPAAGKILLQSEGFELFVRTFELRPLKK